MNLVGGLLACATCYGAKDAPLTQGLNLAILTLLGVTAVVLGGLGVFLFSLARRARRAAPPAAAGPLPAAGPERP